MRILRKKMIGYETIYACPLVAECYARFEAYVKDKFVTQEAIFEMYLERAPITDRLEKACLSNHKMIDREGIVVTDDDKDE